MQVSWHSEHTGYTSAWEFENYKVFLLVCRLDFMYTLTHINRFIDSRKGETRSFPVAQAWCTAGAQKMLE